MCSISASLATLAFNKYFIENVNNCIDNNELDDKLKKNTMLNRFNKAVFDSRVFNLPKEEVCNCFIWRQQDATRNAIQMVGRTNFSHKSLENKNCNQIQEKLFIEKDINFNDFKTHYKRGSCVIKKEIEANGVVRNKWFIDTEIPIFTQNRDYIDQYIYQ